MNRQTDRQHIVEAPRRVQAPVPETDTMAGALKRTIRAGVAEGGGGQSVPSQLSEDGGSFAAQSWILRFPSRSREGDGWGAGTHEPG